MQSRKGEGVGTIIIIIYYTDEERNVKRDAMELRTCVLCIEYIRKDRNGI